MELRSQPPTLTGERVRPAHRSSPHPSAHVEDRGDRRRSPGEALLHAGASAGLRRPFEADTLSTVMASRSDRDVVVASRYGRAATPPARSLPRRGHDAPMQGGRR